MGLVGCASLLRERRRARRDLLHLRHVHGGPQVVLKIDSFNHLVTENIFQTSMVFQ